ncbi:MAG TPA: HtaA domain-containing protein [Conexibacter sp.]|nr:HtaA domain-containing protein [Conexibacter sp.]
MPAAATALALLAASGATHGSTTIAFDGALARSLREQGVAVARQAVLPVAGGRLGNGAALALRGRLTLRAGSGRSARRVTFTAWRAQVRSRQATLSAFAIGRRRTVMSAAVPARKLTLSSTTGAVELRRVELRLTRTGARFLRTRLDLARLSAGVLGTLRVAARLGGAAGGGRGGGPGGGGGGGGGEGGPTPPPGCTPGFGSGPIEPAPAPLTRPVGAADVTSATLTWRPRSSFIQYVASGEGATASEGATAGPEEVVVGNPARLVYSFGFELKPGSWFHAGSGTAGLLARGTVRFRYSGHGIDIRVKDPEIEIDGSRSRAIFTFVGEDCTVITNVRGVMLDLAPGAPTGTPPSYDYGQIPATITDAGSSMFSGFYLPGDAWGSFAVAFTSGP